jgi:hypothetical protein
MTILEKSMRARAGVWLRTGVVALAGGALAWRLRLPLPWLLGALVACAALRLRGFTLGIPRAAQSIGQWVIGTALGLYFTPAVVSQAAEWAPWIALAVLWSFFLGVALSSALARWGGVDSSTAYWSGPIGAAAEMVIQGERAGAQAELVAAAHSLRLLLVVVILPLSFDWMHVYGHEVDLSSARVVDASGLLCLVLLTLAGALGLRRLRGPNPWMLGPLAVALTLTASGHAPSALPSWVAPLGQLLIGMSLGGRFGPGFFRRAPRFLGVVAVVTLCGLLGSAALAKLIGWAAGIAVPTMILATSPGGIAEMCLTAQALQLGVPVVTAFHATRVVFLLVVAQGVWRRSRGWLERLVERRALSPVP